MSKVLCVLYDDPVDGYPPAYARKDIPRIERYPGGQTVPSPQQVDLLVNGFDRLFQLWQAAKSGLL